MEILWFLVIFGAVVSKLLKRSVMFLLLILTWSVFAWANKYTDQVSAWLLGGKWYYHTVVLGDNLDNILKKYQVRNKDRITVLKLPKVSQYTHKLQVGKKIAVLVGKGKLLNMYMAVKDGATLIVNIDSGHYKAILDTGKLVADKQVRHTSFTINNSLYVAAKKYNVPTKLITKLVTVLENKVDLNRSIHKGDRVTITYSVVHGVLGDQYQLMDGSFCHKKQCYRAIAYTDKHDRLNYYDPQGRQLQRVFNRVPLQKYRISSYFSRHRWHPVLNTWRSHLGVDLAARTGSKLHATGDGVVSFAGLKGGYGRVVMIKHGNKYTTVYGHMSKIAKHIKVGSKVARGQIIGYVGQTGLATGPHCHYEFRINDKQVNPLTVKLPSAKQLPKSELSAFKNRVKYLNQWMTISA